MNSTELLREKIVEMVEEKDHVTFAEVETLDGAKGNVGIGANSPSASARIIYWEGLSEAAVEAVRGLMKSDSPVGFVLCNPVSYVIDGKALALPIAHPTQLEKRAARSFREIKDFWLPLYLRPIDRTEEDERWLP